MSKKAIYILALAIISLTIAVIIKSRQSQSKETKTLLPKETEEQKKAKVDSMLIAFKREKYLDLGSRIERFSTDNYTESAIKAAEGGGELDEIRELLVLALNDTATSKEAKKWKASLIQKQIKAYPILRNAWADDIKTKMWVNDIDVKVSGAGKTILTYTGGTFASNQNKQDMQEAISTAMHNLRFKRVNYKWYSGDEKYTYYTIDSPKDSDF